MGSHMDQVNLEDMEGGTRESHGCGCSEFSGGRVYSHK